MEDLPPQNHKIGDSAEDPILKNFGVIEFTFLIFYNIVIDYAITVFPIFPLYPPLPYPPPALIHVRGLYI